MGAEEVTVQAALQLGLKSIQSALQWSLRSCCLGCSSVGADEVAVQSALQWELMRWLLRLLFSGG